MSESQKAVGAMWSIAGLTSLYVTANMAFSSHGSEFFLPSIKLEKTDPHSAAFYGIVFTLPLIFSVLYLTRVYIDNFAQSSGWSSLPIAFNRNLDEIPKFKVKYQVLFLFLFLFVPSLLHIDFFIKFFHGTVYFQHDGSSVLVAWDQLSFNVGLWNDAPNGFRYGDVEKGIDYYPIVMPWTVVILEVVHISLFTSLTSRVYKVLRQN
ncbi:hypothetical protein [Vibrio coralliilyticus]|uniref:hypothetical protein n=1 Tax=Vibrio coralliilyticus TaxID=190893 RepID=UPI000BAAB5AF|nr:hypothetical protein [Vibrio coralliilyticus]NOI60495.1 hypothetical protein [Vibrio coralliilyticus]PAT67311.1 hypothetical protein CKA27_15830 [Vibrio coralliilyticus]